LRSQRDDLNRYKGDDWHQDHPKNDDKNGKGGKSADDRKDDRNGKDGKKK